MADPADTDKDGNEQRTEIAGRTPRRWLVLIAIAVVAGVFSWVMATAVVPRWWAQRVGDVVDGRITAGTILGLCAGTLFTVLPLTALAAGWRFRKGWRRFLGFVIVALVLAGPNLATLGIVVGNGNAAHAGQRILDVDGPGYRGGTLVGAIAGAALFAAVGFLASSRRRNRAAAKGLRAELADLED